MVEKGIKNKYADNYFLSPLVFFLVPFVTTILCTCFMTL